MNTLDGSRLSADGASTAGAPAVDTDAAGTTRPPAAPPADTAPRGIDEIVAAAREGRERVDADDLPRLLEQGAWLIDLRTPWTRDLEGHVPGGVVIEPTVFLWRLDPLSGSRLSDGPGYDDLVITMCNEGYSSTLAARDLRELGFARATDVIGGFRAWAEAGLPIQAEPTRYIT